MTQSIHPGPAVGLVDQAMPHASSALICVAASAWQRIFQLQCMTLRSAMAGRVSTDELSAVPDFQPTLRYVNGVLDIYRRSSDSAMCLMRAQLKGERETVQSLVDAALREFTASSTDAAQAARDTLSVGLESVSGLGAMATDAAARAVQDPLSAMGVRGMSGIGSP